MEFGRQKWVFQDWIIDPLNRTYLKIFIVIESSFPSIQEGRFTVQSFNFHGPIHLCQPISGPTQSVRTGPQATHPCSDSGRIVSSMTCINEQCVPIAQIRETGKKRKKNIVPFLQGLSYPPQVKIFNHFIYNVVICKLSLYHSRPISLSLHLSMSRRRGSSFRAGSLHCIIMQRPVLSSEGTPRQALKRGVSSLKFRFMYIHRVSSIS